MRLRGRVEGRGAQECRRDRLPHLQPIFNPPPQTTVNPIPATSHRSCMCVSHSVQDIKKKSLYCASPTETGPFKILTLTEPNLISRSPRDVCVKVDEFLACSLVAPKLGLEFSHASALARQSNGVNAREKKRGEPLTNNLAP